MTVPQSSKIQALLPEIRARRAEIEAGRRLPADLVDSLGSAGVFGLAVPRALGGVELELPDHLRVIETLSAADGSTGWCAMIALGNGFFAGFMPERGAKEVFADTTKPTGAAIAPTGTAERVPGGVRVNGRWRFASGVDHATWVLGGCVVLEGGSPRTTPSGFPELMHPFMPASQVQIQDTWHVSGLCGTGSHDFVASDVFVPDEHLVDVFDVSRHRPEALYQMPVLPVFAAHVAAVGLGIARAAIDEFTELVETKMPSFSTVVLAEKPVTHVELARAETQLSAARSCLHDAIDDLWQTVVAERPPSKRQHALCRAAALYASESASNVTRAIGMLTGGTAVFSSEPIQRHVRDAEAVTHHATQSPHVWEEAGRMLLGREPLFPIV